MIQFDLLKYYTENDQNLLIKALVIFFLLLLFPILGTAKMTGFLMGGLVIAKEREITNQEDQVLKDADRKHCDDNHVFKTDGIYFDVIDWTGFQSQKSQIISAVKAWDFNSDVVVSSAFGDFRIMKDKFRAYAATEYGSDISQPPLSFFKENPEQHINEIKTKLKLIEYLEAIFKTDAPNVALVSFFTPSE